MLLNVCSHKKTFQRVYSICVTALFIYTYFSRYFWGVLYHSPLLIVCIYGVCNGFRQIQSRVNFYCISLKICFECFFHCMKSFKIVTWYRHRCFRRIHRCLQQSEELKTLIEMATKANIAKMFLQQSEGLKTVITFPPTVHIGKVKCNNLMNLNSNWIWEDPFKLIKEQIWNSSYETNRFFICTIKM